MGGEITYPRVLVSPKNSILESVSLSNRGNEIYHPESPADPLMGSLFLRFI